MQFPAYDVQGIVAVTDPTTGYIYLTGGYTKYIDGRVSFVDKYHPSRPTESVTFIPYPATGFVSRRYVGNVFCKPWGGILYFGGYNFENKLIAEANVITLLDVSTNSFSTLVSSSLPYRPLCCGLVVGTPLGLDALFGFMVCFVA